MYTLEKQQSSAFDAAIQWLFPPFSPHQLALTKCDPITDGLSARARSTRYQLSSLTGHSKWQ
ncbi:MAG TPA: hypothetical protein VIS54_09010 [Psychromonas sp.]